MLPKIKKIYLLTICIISFSLYSWGQKNDAIINLTADQAQKLYKSEQAIKDWMIGLQTPGVQIEDNQMKLNKEARKLLTNEDYRKEVYKDVYSFLDVKESLRVGDLQKAFWQMINLYPENKQNVIRFIYAYDSVIETDKIVAGAFYTYALFDPKITKIENGKPTVHRPDILEDYLRRVKEIVAYIAYFREQGAEKVQN